MNSVYLDTCIISGLAKEDLTEKELNALMELLKLHKKGEVSLVTSSVTMQELEKIPSTARRKHELIYLLLKDIPISRAKWTDSGLTLMGVGGGSREDPLYTKLKEILPDENDRHHVFQALKSKSTYFVTTDRKTILKHNKKLFLEFDEFMVLSPSEIIELLSVNTAG